MNDLYSVESNTARQRKLDALFADQPFLSVTMRASRLHERAMPEPEPYAIPTISDDEDDVLRRMIEGRAGRPDELADDQWWLAPMPVVTRESIPVEEIRDEQPAIESVRAQSRRPRPDTSQAPAVTDGSQLHFDLVVEMTPDGPQVAQFHSAAAAPDVMTAREAASYLRVSQSSLRVWTRDMAIPHVRVGRRMRYRKAALLSWLAEWERA